MISWNHTATTASLNRTQPIIFLNACQTGQEAFALTGISGWAQRFITRGASAFIGSLWSIDDEAACKFAQPFYGQLLANRPIGEAAKEARAVIRSLNDPTWLSYTLFADPLATLS